MRSYGFGQNIRCICKSVAGRKCSHAKCFYLRGHFNYYGIAGNAESLKWLRYLTVKAWKRSLSKRSRRGALTWEAFVALQEKHPLAPIGIRISYPQLAAYARL